MELPTRTAEFDLSPRENARFRVSNMEGGRGIEKETLVRAQIARNWVSNLWVATFKEVVQFIERLFQILAIR